jgi:uncharacterized protein YcfJ
MSENNPTSFDSPSQLWKWATLLLLALITIFVTGSIVRAKSGPPSSAAVVGEVTPQAPAIVNESAPQAPAKAETPKSKPAPRVVAANTQPASPIAPRSPSSSDIAACNQYAASARTQPIEIVRDGAIGAALGAGVGAASGAIADGKKGAGKGAGIGAVVGGVAGTAYSLNQRQQDDARADAAYRTCLAQRGF